MVHLLSLDDIENKNQYNSMYFIHKKMFLTIFWSFIIICGTCVDHYVTIGREVYNITEILAVIFNMMYCNTQQK